MIELPNTTKQKISCSMRASVHDELMEFVSWAKNYQDHAEAGVVVEYILGETFGSSRQEMRAFREWQEQKEDRGKHKDEQGDEERQIDSSEEMKGEDTGEGKGVSSVEGKVPVVEETEEIKTAKEEARRKAREMLKRPAESNGLG